MGQLGSRKTLGSTGGVWLSIFLKTSCISQVAIPNVKFGDGLQPYTCIHRSARSQGTDPTKETPGIWDRSRPGLHSSSTWCF